ncbi:conserved hypothetical protein [Arthrobacter sp. Hiyo8]|nr:conserved hypothetical protein [Arthrobacter sp. Hiyo8]
MTSNPNTPSNGDDSPVDPLAEMLKNLMGGQGMGNIDPAELAKAAGLPNDPNMLQQMFAQVQAMMSSTSEGPVNWQLAHENARRVAAAGTDPSVNALQAREVDEALRLAELWLDPVTDLQATGLIGRAWSRAEWVEATLATWKRLTEPVANSIANALSDALTQQMPEEMKAMMGGTSSMLQNMGGAIFGMQLGQAIGALSAEVVSSTDIGVPLADLEMALLPANVAKFGEGLSVPESDVRLFLAVREAAHARLFVQVPWLRGHLLGPSKPTPEASTSTCPASRTSPGTSIPATPRGFKKPCPKVCSRPSALPNNRLPWRNSKLPWRWLRAGWTSSRLLPPRMCCHPPSHSARLCGGAAPREDPPNTRSPRWWDSSCARGACAKPPRCGPP